MNHWQEAGRRGAIRTHERHSGADITAPAREALERRWLDLAEELGHPKSRAERVRIAGVLRRYHAKQMAVKSSEVQRARRERLPEIVAGQNLPTHRRHLIEYLKLLVDWASSPSYPDAALRAVLENLAGALAPHTERSA